MVFDIMSESAKILKCCLCWDRKNLEAILSGCSKVLSEKAKCLGKGIVMIIRLLLENSLVSLIANKYGFY